MRRMLNKKCAICNQPLRKRAFSIMSVLLNIKGELKKLTVEEVISVIEEYIDKQRFHISATEIFVYRPDTLLESLKAYYNVKFDEEIFIGLAFNLVCPECYDLYISLHPLI